MCFKPSVCSSSSCPQKKHTTEVQTLYDMRFETRRSSNHGPSRLIHFVSPYIGTLEITECLLNRSKKCHSESGCSDLLIRLSLMIRPLFPILHLYQSVEESSPSCSSLHGRRTLAPSYYHSTVCFHSAQCAVPSSLFFTFSESSVAHRERHHICRAESENNRSTSEPLV